MFPKHRLLRLTKALEIVAMSLMWPALLLADRGQTWGLLVVLFLLATQFTFFGPAKYGIVPELLPDGELSRANGLLEMSTFVAIVLGTSIGGELFERWAGQPSVLGGILVAIAVAGTFTSLRIPAVAAAMPDQRVQINPWAEIGSGIRRVWPDRTLWMTIIGTSFFWFLGALLQIGLFSFGQDVLLVSEAASTRLFTFLAIGIGIGSLIAGRLSGEKVEPGLVPIGSFGMGLFSLALVWAAPSYAIASVALALLGFFAGFFAVPLNALIQQRPAASEKGRVLAATNFLNTLGILLASAVVGGLTGPLRLTIDRKSTRLNSSHVSESRMPSSA